MSRRHYAGEDARAPGVFGLRQNLQETPKVPSRVQHYTSDAFTLLSQFFHKIAAILK